MEIPDDNAWIDDSLEEVAVGQHALYAADLPPLGPASAEQQAQVNIFEQSFHQSLARNFSGDAVQQATELQQQQLPPQGAVEQPQAGTRAANERRVHKADREKLRRDRLNEQFSELASALDPDRPKNDKATILGDSVQELNELRAEVKRLKAEHATLLDESRDLTQEKSELREEKALLKSETEQLQAQLQQRLRLALSWPAMDPSLMMSAFPYPVPVPAPPTGPSQPPTSSSPTQSTSAQAPASIIPPSPFMPPLPPPSAFAMHPYAAMFANRPSGTNLPFFPYYHPPPGLVPGPNSSIERPFAQYPVRSFGVPASEGEAPFKPPFLAANQATLREDNAQATESTDVCQASGETTTVQKEGAPSQASRSPAESPEIHKDPPISPAA